MLIDRRTLLKLTSAAALVACGSRDADGLRVVVAGAGIIGASVALHLSQRGAQVTIIDREGPAARASRGTFAWINATWAKQPRSYHQFSQTGVTGWHALESQLGLSVRWGGSIEWFGAEERQDRLAEQIEEQAAWGEPARMLSAQELTDLEPRLQARGASRFALSPNDGAVDPVLATNAMLSAAQAAGANLLYPAELSDVVMRRGQLFAVETTDGRLRADHLVLATGADPDAPRLFAGIDIPQRTTPGFIIITEPLPMMLNHIIAAPGVHMHQRTDGRLVLGEQEGAPSTHTARLAGRPQTFPDPSFAEQHARPLLEIAGGFLPGVERARIDEAFIGWRPLPLDGHPVLGASPERPGVHLAIAHSGVTLAPVIGSLLAENIISGESNSALTDYRPDRSFTEVRRY